MQIGESCRSNVLPCWRSKVRCLLLLFPNTHSLSRDLVRIWLACKAALCCCDAPSGDWHWLEDGTKPWPLRGTDRPGGNPQWNTVWVTCNLWPSVQWWARQGSACSCQTKWFELSFMYPIHHTCSLHEDKQLVSSSLWWIWLVTCVWRVVLTLIVPHWRKATNSLKRKGFKKVSAQAFGLLGSVNS